MTLPLYVGKNQWPSPTKKRKEDGPPLKHNILYMSKMIPKNINATAVIIALYTRT
jgi:hypothetical protein